MAVRWPNPTSQHALRAAMGGDGRMKKLASSQGKDDIPRIIKELKAADQQGKEKNAHLLDMLSEQEECVKAMGRSGAIAPLVELVAKGNDGGQIHAASTLSRIASADKEFLSAIIAAGAVQPLVILLRMGSQKAQMFAAAALASISEDYLQQKPIIKAGAISPLVRLLRVGALPSAHLGFSGVVRLGRAHLGPAPSVTARSSDGVPPREQIARRSCHTTATSPACVDCPTPCRLPAGIDDAKISASSCIANLSSANKEAQVGVDRRGDGSRRLWSTCGALEDCLQSTCRAHRPLTPFASPRLHD